MEIRKYRNRERRKYRNMEINLFWLPAAVETEHGLYIHVRQQFIIAQFEFFFDYLHVQPRERQIHRH